MSASIRNFPFTVSPMNGSAGGGGAPAVAVPQYGQKRDASSYAFPQPVQPTWPMGRIVPLPPLPSHDRGRRVDRWQPSWPNETDGEADQVRAVRPGERSQPLLVPGLREAAGATGLASSRGMPQ